MLVLGTLRGMAPDVQVASARVRKPVRDILEQSGLLDRIGVNHLGG